MISKLIISLLYAGLLYAWQAHDIEGARNVFLFLAWASAVLCVLCCWTHKPCSKAETVVIFWWSVAWSAVAAWFGFAGLAAAMGISALLNLVGRAMTSEKEWKS